MFLKKNNSIKWDWVLYGAGICTALMIFCLSWFDVWFVNNSYNFDLALWHIFEIIFDAKVWLAGSAILAGGYLIHQIIKSKKSIKDFIAGYFKNLKEFKKQSAKNYGFMIFASVFVASVIGFVLKVGLGRQRPIFLEGLGQTGFEPMSFSWAYNSMPSGHTIVSFAGLVMIGLLFPKYKVFTWGAAILVAVSRLLSGAHFPLDVLLGAFLGMLIADFVKSYFYKDA